MPFLWYKCMFTNLSSIKIMLDSPSGAEDISTYCIRIKRVFSCSICIYCNLEFLSPAWW
uniref:Uncharacterized protein LOC105645849 isoform X1 n=1 Tax=Rhizophora mucronata TaxID=61149 RepID=A0A2P2LDH0_RHIMU